MPWKKSNAPSGTKIFKSVLLISDGQYNTGRNPIHVAANYGFPIHTLVVGDTLQEQDLLIARTITNELAYVGQEVPVDVTLDLRGYSNERVTTRLYAQDSLITAETIAISEGESTLSLRLIPKREGLVQFTLTTTELENEASTANNRTTFTVRVLKRNETIALIAAAPHPDVMAMRNILTRDQVRQVDSYVQMQAGKFYEGDLPATLEDYDAILLIGFPGPEADDRSLNLIADAAESGVPIFFQLTRRTDLRRLKEAFSLVLPALPATETMLYDEAILDLTSSGRQNPILNFLTHHGIVSLP